MAFAAVVAGVMAAFLVVRNNVHLPFPGQPEPRIHDATSLPGSISVCGREWHRDELERQFIATQLDERYEAVPTFVDVGFLPGCPSGACTTTAAGSCSTVIWVRVGADAYIGYLLQGGP
jgi:hypothetical protein